MYTLGRVAAYRVQGVGGSVTFTRRPPPAEVGEWRRRLKGCEVLPCAVPIGDGREAAAVRPSRPARIESASGRPTVGLSTVRAGWHYRSRARTSEGGGFAVAGPRSESPAACTVRTGRHGHSPARTGGGGGSPSAVGHGPHSESPAACTVRAGRHGHSPVRVGEGGGSPRLRATGPSRSHPLVAPSGRGGTATPRPGPMRTAGRRVGARGSPSNRWLRRQRLESCGYPERRVDPSILARC